MPDEFDDTLTRALYGWDGTHGWYRRRQIGAAQGYYCNLCGDKLSDDSPTWPIREARHHRERYRDAVGQIQARGLITLNQNEDRELRLYSTGLLFPIFDALESNDGTDHARYHVAPLLEPLGRMGGLTLGSIICLPAGYRVLAASHLDLPHYATALRLAVERGPDFFEAIEGAADVEGLLEKLIDQQIEGVPVWPNY